MDAFCYGICLQWKLDMRNKGVLLTYYIVPLVFFAFMGGIFSSIDPNSKNTLIQSMTVFSVSMGALLGAPIPLVEFFSSEIKKSYKVGGIPLWTVIINNFISGFIHLSLVSIIIFFTAPFVFDSAVPDNILLYFAVLLLFIISSLMIGTALGLFVKSISKLTMISQFVFLPSIMLSGIMFPVTMLPKAFDYAGKLFPSTWGFFSMCKDSFGDLSLGPLLMIIIVFGIFCVIGTRKETR
ncbi:ABC transporter permease [Clostridium polynesiense]|uniref:ABC transporter permease n=1 Tax=Clostridium polynesiense TaxID=1325933 RepID=UPI00058CFC52|nr:ABC transporter permease [Clostridium polynesiense]